MNAQPATPEMTDRETTADARSGTRVAIVSIGIGRVQRGYERYFGDLFSVLREATDATLYKSAGKRTRDERVPRLLGPVTALVRLLPLGKGLEGEVYRKYRHDCLAYMICLLPVLLRGRFDVIHVIDHPLAKALERLGRIVPYRTRIVFANGWGATPDVYPRVDLIHHIAGPLYEQCLVEGVDPETVALVPCGIDTRRFRSALSKEELRDKHGVGRETFVIVVVSALNRYHKRVDHVIREVSAVEGDLLLWIDGNPEDPTVAELAESLLGDRCRITHVPSEQVADLYGLADLMVHGAVTEAFGLAVVEANSAGLRVLAHDSEHFYWLIGDPRDLVDMTEQGALSARLSTLLNSDDPALPEQIEREAAERSRRAIERFDWRSLAPRYLAMYEAVVSGTIGLRRTRVNEEAQR